MSRFLGVLLACLLLFSGDLKAQEHSAQIEYLNKWVGTWTFDTLEGETECEKVGDYIVDCRTTWKTASGAEREAVFITRFDPETETFLGYRFYSTGSASYGPGWIDGDTDVFIYDMPGGTRAKVNQTWSGEKLTYEWYRSTQGGPWVKTSEGSWTKVR
ncbi:MAG: hypothetical protein PVJ76_13565 [Gemmatimonadota bacterium]